MPHNELPLRRVAGLMLSPVARLVLLVLLLAGGACVVLAIGSDDLLGRRTDDAAPGIWTVPLLTLVYALATLAFVPKPALSAAAGAVLGIGPGLTVAVAGTVLGALLAFLLARILGRDALRPMLRAPALAKVEQRLSERPFTTVLLLRLVPVMPFALVNLGAAVSRTPWAPFAAATLLGTLPGSTAYVLAGASASDPSSPGLWIPVAVCVALLAAGALWRRRTRDV
ncbi:TVP38/TMEM64 family protein [Streptomyces avicenniae]|uniref:TVP38/TMEM64 family protein n=1 Tax=Streptomyces avicenniae TaxID=500153 RepID=UPI00069C22AE|nr:VTT domain-containing protein [Streptomyces avicenniae]